MSAKVVTVSPCKRAEWIQCHIQKTVTNDSLIKSTLVRVETRRMTWLHATVTVGWEGSAIRPQLALKISALAPVDY